MEVLWLKSQRLPHKQIAKLAGVCDNALTKYLRLYRHGGLDEVRNVNFYRPKSKLEQYSELIEPYASILDAGCGSGRGAFYFSGKGYRVTVFDYSPPMVKQATKLTGSKALQLSFQDLTFENQFDGVWACSSLLHFPMDEMHDAIYRLSRSMKIDGVLYASFKYGKGEYNRNGRFCVDLYEEGADDLIGQHPELTAIRYWQTSDLRPGREKEKWMNLLVRKTRPTRKITFLGARQSPAPQ